MKKPLFTLIFISLAIFGFAKNPPSAVERVDPPMWWVGMETNTIELLFYGEKLKDATIVLKETNTRIVSIVPAANPKYTYVTIEIGQNQMPGELTFEIQLKGAKKKTIYKYSLLGRTGKKPLGIHGADNMYLLFPDRFANGDTTNDSKKELFESVNRKELKGRHGGDIKGIVDHIPYLADLGVTALWINPLVQNNQPKESYHGYACTDSYRIDARFGTSSEFLQMCSTLRDKKIKLVWDIVYNHWGNEHVLFKSLPDSNWINWHPEFTRTNYRTETLVDPYAPESEKKAMTDGWFDYHMPDLNQRDPHLAKYLIQNSIWWIEYAGIDAFRIDTYPYPDQQFMSDCNAALKKEYPTLNIFGETWVNTSPVQAWYTEDNGMNPQFSSHLDGVTDFQLYFAFIKGLNENFGWEEGFRRIELTLIHDILYENAYRNVTFLDNHDLSRIYSVLGEDFDKWKMGMSMIHTLRGIPCTYYGNEILMKNFSNPDALVREDFSGGWVGDTINKFDRKQLNTLEGQAFDYSKALMQWRKQNTWMADAKLTQYVPFDNTYVYFRTSGEHILMCVYSLNDKPFELDLKRFAESMQGRSRGANIIDGNRVFLQDKLTVPAKGTVLIELH
ncbi:MAG: alpha-amylase family glycosyl hydrolase [Flavobacteriales bacterium]